MTPESAWSSILCWAGLIALLVIAVRLAQQYADRERRNQTRQLWEERELERERERFLDEVDRYYPFVREAVQAGVASGQGIEEAFLAALESVPAAHIGTTSFGLPALLPLDERRKHLYVVGKTGSGKTSLLLNLIEDDLAEGRGVGVIAPEAELFRDWLLPMVPEERSRQVVYFAPGNPDNPVTFNPLAIEPGDDRSRAAGELFAIFKRAIGDEGLGARMGPILGNAFAILTGRLATTLWDLKRLLEDRHFREMVAAETEDQYLREFWLRTYESYPKGSHLPVINRLDQFLRPVPLRRALTHPISSFSIRTCLARGHILFFDLSSLAPDAMLLLGQMLLSKFQLELMRRENVPAKDRLPFYLFADEFQTFSGVAEGTWRELLSRGRRYGLALSLGNQFPGQLPQALRDEIFGNVASMVALNLGSKDAQAVRGEFLELPHDGGPAQPIAPAALVGLRVGQGVARLGGGAFALRVNCSLPPVQHFQTWGQTVRNISWKIYGVTREPDAKTTPLTPQSSRVAKQQGRDVVIDEIEDEVID